jgi:hypothetical protein
MTGPDRNADTATTPQSRRRLPLLGPLRTGAVVALAFVAGLLVGAVAVGLLSPGPVVVASPGEAGPADDEGAAGTLPPEDATVEFVVSGACLGSVNAAQDTLVVLGDVGDAAAELDAARLDEIVRRLMPLQRRLESGLEACRVATEVDAGGPAGTEASAPNGTSPAAPTTDGATGD